MRQDMHKVIVERPRNNSRVPNIQNQRMRKAIRHRLLLEDPDAPKQPMSPRGWDGHDGKKSLSENLRPIFRFLRKQVGRPWDKIYSEMRRVLNFNNAVQEHLVQHVKKYVVVNTVIVGKKVYETTRYGRSFAELHPGDLYVDQHGLLKVYSPRKVIVPKEKAQEVLLESGRMLRQMNGVWYEIRYARLDLFDPNIRLYRVKPVWEAKKGQPISMSRSFDLFIVIDKRQLSKKELIQYGVKDGR